MTPAAGALVLVCLYLVELSTLASVLTLQRRGDRLLTVFLANPAGWICVAALLALAACLIGLVAVVRRVPAPRARRLAVPLVVNLCSVTLVFVVAEATVRALATPDIQGPVVAGTPLLPHSWTDVAARGRAGLERAAAGQSYLVPDPDLGWTIGPNRQSADYNREGVARFLAQLGLAPRVRPRPMRRRHLSEQRGGAAEPAGRPVVRRPAGQASHRRRGRLVHVRLEVRYEDTWRPARARARSGVPGAQLRPAACGRRWRADSRAASAAA